MPFVRLDKLSQPPASVAAAPALRRASLSHGVATLLLALSPLAGHAQTCPGPQPQSNMKLTFDSEFTSGAISSTQWNNFPNEPVPLGGDDESYTPSEVSVSKSAGLQLTTEAKPLLGLPYSSGEVSTRGLFSQEYGHFEMMARMPQADGMWPAFWLLPEDNSWPPEIDILEYIYAPWGHIPTASNNTSYASDTLHWVDTSGHAQSSTFDVSTSLTWGNSYHTYAIDWRPGSLVWMLDGNVVRCMTDTQASGARVPAKPMFMIINDAVSKQNGWPGTIQSNQAFPLGLDIAYVRVWSFNDLPPTPPPSTGAIRNTTISRYTVSPGQSVQIKTNLVIGDKALGESDSIVQIKSWNGQTTYASIYVSANLPANTTVPIGATYTIPASLQPGQYVVSVWTAYNNWASAFYNPEAQIFTVTPPQ